VLATFHAAGDSASYRYLRPMIKPAADNIAHAVAVSKDAADLVRRYIGGNFEILYNGVELDAYRSAPPHATTGPTIFFCGRHEERKGLDVLLAAMTELGPEVTLWIASSGPDTERLRQQTAADARIKWLGRISDEEKISRLRGADVFCAPSLHGESFGVVLIEAMAAGTCIVASALDGYRNVATDDIDSLLVAPGDAAALAAAVKRVLHDPALSARLVAAGSTRADDFSMAALARHYLAMYHEVAPPPSRTRRPMSPWPFMSGPVSPRRRRRTRMMAP
jgi:phosphatidylinositol alpha-mannosyltransferase